MARLKPALSEKEIGKMGLAKLREAYMDVAENYTKLIEGEVIICPMCGEPLAAYNFYQDSRFAIGMYPICKKCLMGMACDYNKRDNTYTDNFDKMLKVLEMLDLPYIDSLYQSAYTYVHEEGAVGNKVRKTAYSQYLSMVKALVNFKDKHWKDSEFPAEYFDKDEEQIAENSRLLKQAKKRFGDGYPNADLIFLETEYQDWIKRYACENKAQEILFKRICFKELDLDKAQKAGKDTKELDKTLQDLMTSMSLKPNQSNSNALTEAKTFGQLIQKWESEKPIPEPDEEFRDVNKIGKYIDIFFRGHTSHMMGMKNAFSVLYDNYMKKFAIERPELDEEDDSDTLFDQIFGTEVDDV